jgi:predicted ATPase/Tfp pilus assembly protein PilF
MGKVVPISSLETQEVLWKIPDHELLVNVGAGAFGEVWLARSLTGSYRAVKIVRRQRFQTDQSFQREFQGVQKFEPISRDHEGLVDILHVGRNEAGGFFYYIMEIADDQTSGRQVDPFRYAAKTLHGTLGEGQPWPVETCIRIGIALAAALEHLHAHGLVHRDIKPGNIIFVRGVPKLADIGLVTDAGQDSYVGTPGYIPPEGPGQPAADVFSLGKVLYQLNTGKNPQDYPELPTGLPDDPARAQRLALNQIILKACEANPAARYSSAADLRADLLRLQEGRPVDGENRPNNLPAPTTSFIGRETEKEQIRQLLTTSRLLTLKAFGGCGKTRLALEVAREELPTYPDGVWFVDFSALVSPGLVVHAVALALNIVEEPHRPLVNTLAERVRSWHALLVLDNCEHLIEPCAQLVAALLRACPTLKILATSREALGLTGERILDVSPLAVPSVEGNIGESESERLFVERAQAVQPSFTLTGSSQIAVRQICRQLEGIPLAIELAAARVPILTPTEIATRLSDRFRALGSGQRGLLPRQQTLRALIDWSYALLSSQEQALMRRLAVFAGGWSLAAAEAVCADDSLQEWEVLDLIGRLAAKSLVHAEPHRDTTRYRFLETVREYAWQKTQEHKEDEFIRQRHLEFFLRFAEAAEPHLTEADQEVWIERLAADHDNLRRALQRSLSVADGGTAALRLGNALWWFWHLRGDLTEGRSWLRSALECGKTAPPELRARALNGAGGLAYYQADYPAAQAHYQEALHLFTQLGDHRSAARTRNNLGLVANDLGAYSEARRYFEPVLAELRQAGDDPYALAAVLNNLGRAIREQSDYPAAQNCLEESLTLRRQLGVKQGIAVSLYNLGVLARERGDAARALACLNEALAVQRALGSSCDVAWTLNELAGLAMDATDIRTARPLLEESLSLFKAVGDTRGMATAQSGLAELKWLEEHDPSAFHQHQQSLETLRQMQDNAGIASVLEPLGKIALQRGDAATARRFFAESLAIYQRSGSRRLIARGLENIAGVLLVERHPQEALVLLSAAASLRATIGAPHSPRELIEFEAYRAAAQERIGCHADGARWSDGHQIALDDAISHALSGQFTVAS